MRQDFYATFNADVDIEIKSIMFASMGIFGSLVFDMEELRQSFPDSFWLDFPLIQECIKEAKEEGLERGLKRGQMIVVIDLILESLADRFQNDNIQEIKPMLEEIQDLDWLKQLLKSVQIVQSLQEFKNDL